MTASVFGIGVGGGFVQDHDGRVLEHGAGDGHALALAATGGRGAAHDGIVALFKLHDEVMAPLALATASTALSLALRLPMRMFSRTVS
jgi:hypothetical protein